MNEIKTIDSVQSVASVLAAACLQRTLDEGRTIEIPSLGIKIQPTDKKIEGGS